MTGVLSSGRLSGCELGDHETGEPPAIISRLISSDARSLDADVNSTSSSAYVRPLSCSDDDETLVTRTKKRVHRFTDSEGESDEIHPSGSGKGITSRTVSNSHSDSTDSDEMSIFKSAPHTSRLRKMSSGVSSDSDSKENQGKSSNEEESSYTKNKRSKLKQKFHSLIKSRAKETEKQMSKRNDKMTNNDEQSESSNASDDELSSVNKIKEIIKEKTAALKSDLYDPDTSDEESSIPQHKPPLQGKERKRSIKLTSPKPVRMSAKEAMGNMQKIKSESNRMLREKEVSLPYHRPKALSLKDIMSRRRPAVSADGKALPIKMNEEQLKQYVEHLEQRQKEVIELCKSESEEDDADKNENDMISQNDSLYDDLPKNVLGDADDKMAGIEINNIVQNTEKESSSVEDIGMANTVEFTSNVEYDKMVTETNSENVDEQMQIDININVSAKQQQDCPEDKNNSADISLVYNDSIEEINVNAKENKEITENMKCLASEAENDTKIDSQSISLHFSNTENDNVEEKETVKDTSVAAGEDIENIDFSDDDVNMEDIDALIENAEIVASQKTGNEDSSISVKEISLKSKPKLTGAPGMVIDLDDADPSVTKTLTGVELLKERFVYFAKLKTPEEIIREREKTVKPGSLHLKLKQELEDQIAEQRSLEWAKRLEEMKQQQKEMDTLMGESSDAEEDIDKIETQSVEKGDVTQESSSESEEEEDGLEDIKEKPRKRNPMIDDEAEESDCDGEQKKENEEDQERNDGEANNINEDEDESEEESTEESEESDNEQQKPRKGRILKAFEDSDEEDNSEIKTHGALVEETSKAEIPEVATNMIQHDASSHQTNKTTQDDEIQLAQGNKASLSDDLFTSQESQIQLTSETEKRSISDDNDDGKDLGTQTFSILESTVDKNINMNLSVPDNLSMLCGTQKFDDNLDVAVGLCSGSFSQSQNLVTPALTQSELPPSQAIGDDVLALCTGQFYDNQFVSQKTNYETGISQDTSVISTQTVSQQDTTDFKCTEVEAKAHEKHNETKDMNNDLGNQDKHDESKENKKDDSVRIQEDSNLKCILDELHNPEFDKPKVNKHFIGNNTLNKDNEEADIANTQLKKKFVIDSDDEGNGDGGDKRKKIKRKRKKLEKRALQISDDEDDDQFKRDSEDDDSEMEDEADVGENLLEYDDEENEIVVQLPKPKKKRKVADFFENEAELTSEDEWIGSGDEDERGLDRMEREEGDADTFNQNQLQRELGQIHMRDVLDQDKREVRLIQELLFEDGDLGGGSRQRKFRWRDADGEEGTGIPYSDELNTQEDEFESEEQWRKQRHEREMFLKSLKNQEEPENLNISLNRTSIIKASLSKKSSSVIVEMNASAENEPPIPDKKTAKDIPSPKKPFTIFQQNYHGSLLTRGRGALARLAALATPLANDDDAPNVGSLKPTSKRNFVFTTVDTPEDVDELKIPKRKAENAVTPKLVKKMRTEEKHKFNKSSLLDHLNA